MRILSFYLLSLVVLLTSASCYHVNEAGSGSDSQGSKGDDGLITQTEFASWYCDKFEECDPETMEMLEASGGCVELLTEMGFLNEDQCPDWDEAAAYECLSQSIDYSCDEFARANSPGSEQAPSACTGESLCGFDF